MPMTEPPAVEVEGLAVRFRLRDRVIYAVNGVSFSLAARRGVGHPGRVRVGQKRQPSRLDAAAPGELRDRRPDRDRRARICAAPPPLASNVCAAAHIAMIFQEPMTALDPVFTIGEQIAETIVRHEGISRRDARRRALESAGAGADPVGPAAPRFLSARDVGRHAPARDDRGGVELQPERALGRRADDRARRHRPDPNLAAVARTAARARHGGGFRHPRCRRRRRDQRSAGGDVCRPLCRDRQARAKSCATPPIPTAKGLLAANLHGAEPGPG